MAGHADVKKRSKVRRMLKAKKWQQASERELAGEAECGRSIVRVVRAQMIASGEIPPRDHVTRYGDEVLYKPGTSVRGGYVFDHDGKVVREAVWLKRQRAARSR